MIIAKFKIIFLSFGGGGGREKLQLKLYLLEVTVYKTFFFLQVFYAFLINAIILVVFLKKIPLTMHAITLAICRIKSTPFTDIRALFLN